MLRQISEQAYDIAQDRFGLTTMQEQLQALLSERFAQPAQPLEQVTTQIEVSQL
ncbi:MAG: hypothetical protein HC824_12295 [Synechococcales cyanobacterium RM1_1_8]|nr:hypothetical protein [Synechococcales cyanobacterium RM1_1_8]